MEAQIAQLIEDEVEKRLAERLNKVLEHISKTYDITMKQLLRDTSTLKVAPSNTCLGLTSKKQRCKMKSHGDTGYCKHHQDQKPAIRRQVPSSVQLATTAHNHAGTLFSSDCPACQKRTTTKLRLDI
jgi:hypothetical protein